MSSTGLQICDGCGTALTTYSPVAVRPADPPADAVPRAAPAGSHAAAGKARAAGGSARAVFDKARLPVCMIPASVLFAREIVPIAWMAARAIEHTVKHIANITRLV